MFDFRINSFDVLPDFVGYLLFYLGAAKLQHASDWFRKAKPFCAVMIVLSLPSLVEIQLTTDGAAAIGPALLWMLFSIALLAIDLYIVHAFCRGIESLAEAQDVHELAGTARSRWNLYLILQAMVVFMYFSALIAPFFAAIVTIPLFVFSIIVLVLMMVLMHRSSQQLQT